MKVSGLCSGMEKKFFEKGEDCVKMKTFPFPKRKRLCLRYTFDFVFFVYLLCEMLLLGRIAMRKCELCSILGEIY